MALAYNEQTGMFDEVPDEPRIINFSFEGAPIRYKDESVTFRWELQDAHKVFVNDIEMPYGASSYSLPLSNLNAGLQNFVLKIENGGIQKTEMLQIKVLETPVFNIEQSADKLRKGMGERCTIKWNVQHAQSVTAVVDGQTHYALSSECTVSPEDSADYRFEAIGLDGNRVFRRVVHIGVFEESTVLFEVDKNITLPHVPIKLSWDIRNASRIELIGCGAVESRGEKVIECDRETIYTLKVTDEFGTKEYHQRIKMYPLPLIRSILVPVPHIERNLSVETHFEQKQIQVNINVGMTKIPEFNGIKSDVFVASIPIHHLELTPRKDWLQKITEYNKTLTRRITEKISSLWNK